MDPVRATEPFEYLQGSIRGTSCNFNTSAWATAFPAPIKTEAPTMPTNDGFRLDDQKG
jgi:hypothetical protein